MRVMRDEKKVKKECTRIRNGEGTVRKRKWVWRDENDEEKKVSGVCNKRERGYTCGERRSRREILD